MNASVYVRVLPYEAELWSRGEGWRGDPQELPAQLERRGAECLLVPTSAGNPAPTSIAGLPAQGVSIGLADLPPAARITGVAGVLRSAPPFCEGDLLRRACQGAERAVALLLGPETVGWALRGGRLRDAFRSLDEEALGGVTTGAVESRWAIGQLVAGGEEFARHLFTESGLRALDDGLPAWRHRLRMSVGRLAAALGGAPDTICLGGEPDLVRDAAQVLKDLGPVHVTAVTWGIGAWAQSREE